MHLVQLQDLAKNTNHQAKTFPQIQEKKELDLGNSKIYILGPNINIFGNDRLGMNKLTIL